MFSSHGCPRKALIELLEENESEHRVRSEAEIIGRKSFPESEKPIGRRHLSKHVHSSRVWILAVGTSSHLLQSSLGHVNGQRHQCAVANEEEQSTKTQRTNSPCKPRAHASCSVQPNRCRIAEKSPFQKQSLGLTICAQLGRIESHGTTHRGWAPKS